MEVPAVPYRELTGGEAGESSQTIRERVLTAHARQTDRFTDQDIHINARMCAKDISRYCSVDDDGGCLLETAIKKLGLSARAYTRVLKVSRTIADLEGSETIRSAHIAEAIQYRSLDRQPF